MDDLNGILDLILRGLLISEVNAIKKNTSAQREQVTQPVRCLEAEYIAISGEGAWIAAQDAVNRLDASKADRKRFFHKLPSTRRGNRRGKNSTVTTSFPFYWGST